MPEIIERASLVEETRRRYLSYAMSVITSRALPDVRDGLKPVQRRILYTMGSDLGLRPEGRFTKSAKVVGQVMGTYHPHGDQAIYDAMVRLAQPFTLRYPLVWGQGNFGSLDHDPPAAMRYTEAKLQPLAMEMLDELGQGTVRFRPSYDGRGEEPVVLPARLPQLLLNGTSGIAVGMATNVPPHNLREVVAACVLLIDDRTASLERLLAVVQGPDLPTGGEIVTEKAALREIYEGGRGTLRMRGTYKEEREGRKRLLVIDSIPYGVQKSAIVERAGDLIRARKLPQAVDVRDESTDDVRVVLELRPEADPESVMAYLQRHTPLGETLPFNMTCLVPDGEGTRPERLGLKAVLLYFLDFRFEVVTLRIEHDLKKLEERIHILEGFAIIFEHLDEAIAIVRRSDGREDARGKLVERFGLDDVQADAVLDTRIYRLARLEIDKILKELRAKEKEARRLRSILASPKKRWAIVREELEGLSERYGDDRRTQIVLGAQERRTFDAESFILEEDTHVVVTRDGWIKRVARLRSPSSTRTREGDEVAFVLPGSTRQNVVFFSNQGAAYVMKIHDVPPTSGYGEPIQKHFRFDDGERVIGAVSLDPRVLPEAGEGLGGQAAGDGGEGGGDSEGEGEGEGEATADAIGGLTVFAATAHGHVLRFALAAHTDVSQRTGRRYCRLAGKDDEVIYLELCAPEKQVVVLATARGRAIVFGLDEVSALLGPGKGVRGIKLDKGDQVVAAALSTGWGDALQVETTRGAVHTVAATEDRRTARGGKGKPLLKREGFVRAVPSEVVIPSLGDDDDGGAAGAAADEEE